MEKIKESKEKKVIHIKDWPEGDRPRGMMSKFGGLNGLMSTTSEDLLD